MEAITAQAEKMNKIIIIGGGIAAVNGIQAIREVDPDVAIDLFSEEKYYPYYRLKLSKMLFDKLDEDSTGMLLKPKDWYQQNKVNLHLNVKVLGVNVDRQEILLPQGNSMRYDGLLLANGARNRLLSITGFDSCKLYSIRNLEDIIEIRNEMENKNRVFYIGGGVLGLETAWVIQQHGKKAAIAEIQNRLFPHQLDEKAATILEGLVESFGIRVFTNAEVIKIYGNQAAWGVEMRDGQKFECDMVLYSTGIQPNTDIVKGTPIQINRGIVVNGKMQTSVSNIYAAGDVAEYEGRVYGLWNIAAGQGKIAGYNMAGNSTVYRPGIPVTALNAFGTSLFSMGDVSDTGGVRTIMEEDHAKNIYRRIFVKNQTIIGAICIGDPGKTVPFKNAIEQKLSLNGIEWENITIGEILEELKPLPGTGGNIEPRSGSK